jgi:hypothetical protein
MFEENFIFFLSVQTCCLVVADNASQSILLCLSNSDSRQSRHGHSGVTSMEDMIPSARDLNSSPSGYELGP